MRSLGKGTWGRRVAVMTTVGSLMAFQALAVVGAGPAAAAGLCEYNPATKALSITVNSGTSSVLTVDDTTGSEGDILLDAGNCVSTDLVPVTATVSNTASIMVVGAAGAEGFTIDNAAGLAFPSSISWDVDLGTGSDTLIVYLADGADGSLVFGDASFVMNGAIGVTDGVEALQGWGGDGDDTIDASALTATGPSFVSVGGAGDDVISGGAGDDSLTGGADDDTLMGNDGDDLEYGGLGTDFFDEGTVPNGMDTLDGQGDADNLWYGDRTGCIAIVANGGAVSGDDDNCDGDATDVDDEMDSVVNIEGLWSGSGDDYLEGSGASEYFVPGDGDDVVDGVSDTDTLSFETSAAAVMIDVPNGTAMGQGDDEFTNIDEFVGSDFDDTLIYDGGTVGFDGGAGIDTVDATADTLGVTIDLNTAYANTENALGGSGDDEFTGNGASNALKGNGGDDSLWGAGGRDILNGGPGNDLLVGQAGNDSLLGGNGDDVFAGGGGADTVRFQKGGAAIFADMSLGFASGQGDDSFFDFIEMVMATNKADTVVGGGGQNFRFFGLGGADILTGSAGNDTLKGGAGDDRLRGGAGDDDLYGQGGYDKGWGGAGTDFCFSVEVPKGCE
jgi:hypothetical protein